MSRLVAWLKPGMQNKAKTNATKAHAGNDVRIRRTESPFLNTRRSLAIGTRSPQRRVHTKVPGGAPAKRDSSRLLLLPALLPRQGCAAFPAGRHGARPDTVRRYRRARPSD